MSTIGSIELIAKINTSDYKQGAQEIKQANNDIEGSARQTEKTAISSSEAWGKAGKIGLAAAAAAAVALGTALFKASSASWEQVGAVEQATVGLRAYEQDGAKVNSVLADLIKYARSDLGVLFNRKDLFQSAQSLKLMGDNTDELVGHVQILSRSVGLGLSNWEDLNQIVGRVGSTGRLTGDDFDNLTKAGYRLDPSLRNTNITFGELFKQLDKGIPTNALDGQANTIQGIGIRLQTAFRNVGDAFLGVDSDTSKFKEGGLGSMIINNLKRLTEFLKTPEIKGAITTIGQGLATAFTIANQAINTTIQVLQPLINYITSNQQVMDVLKYTLIALGAILLGAVVVGITAIVVAGAILTGIIQVLIFVVTKIIEAFIWFGGVLMNIGATVGTVATNMVRFFTDAWNNIKNVFSTVGSFFAGVWHTVTSIFGSIGSAVGNAIGNAFRNVVNSVISFAVGKINGFIDAINAVVSIINKIPGVHVGGIGRLPVPQLATGGIVSSATLAVIGEGREPEAVIPLSKLDEMLKNSGSSSNGGKTEVTQNNYISRDIDLQVASRQLAYDMARY